VSATYPATGAERAAGSRPGVPPVHAEGLAKTYPSGTRAVVGLNLEVQPGETLDLLGPNGAGKPNIGI
jgi:ABC-type sugar transport system ATPase subunit